MATIPASQLVQVLPNVLSAGGSALVLNGLVLTQNARVPAGQVLSFANDGSSVAEFFGASADEVSVADRYFGGYNISTKKPSSILFAQYNSTAVAAWLRGGPVDVLTLAELKAVTGSLTVTVDGVDRTAPSIDLSGATSFSAAAALLQTALNASPTQQASVTGAIAAGSASVTASINGYLMTVTDLASGTLVTGAKLTGTGVTAGTKIAGQISGTTGGVGVYAVDTSQTVASTTITAAYGTLTVSAVASGTLSVGQTLAGTGVDAGTLLTALGTGEGLTGTYYVDSDTVVSSGTITADPTDLVVTYDSVRGAFVITSGIKGASSTIAFATGTAAADLYLTEATGATESQGADPAVPGAFMTAITQITQNWATFMHMFDPDGGGGNAQKLAFAVWTNGESKRYAYVARDTDVTATESTNATTSFGNIVVVQDKYDGVCPVYDPNAQNLDAFVCGAAASIDFDATNGRITFAFRGQDGIVAGVTDATVADNLTANGYNFYGAYATAAQTFLEFQTGLVSGEFEWMDSYINQIWLNNAFQLALMELLQNTPSIPYNRFGYGLILAAMSDPISAALNFGAIRAGVTLTSQQAAEVNAAAGVTISDTLQYQGWYAQVKDPSGTTRQARQSPPVNFWYTDGESVQRLILNSVLIQ